MSATSEWNGAGGNTGKNMNDAGKDFVAGWFGGNCHF